MMHFTLPYPPSANRYWRYTRNGVYKTQEARVYQNQLQWIYNREPLTGGVAVHVTVYRPRRAGDLDNRLKVVLDALQGIAYEDDKQIVEIHAIRRDDKRNPRVEIVIVEIDEAAA